MQSGEETQVPYTDCAGRKTEWAINVTHITKAAPPILTGHRAPRRNRRELFIGLPCLIPIKEGRLRAWFY